MSTEDLIFHILDILPRDVIIESESESGETEKIVCEPDYGDEDDDDIYNKKRRNDSKPQSKLQSKLIIHLFGRTADNKSIRVDVEGFCPYFYIETPMLSTPKLKIAVKELHEYIQRNCYFAKDVTVEIEFREKFFGFTNHNNYSFIKLTVKSMKHFYNLRQLFLSKDNRPATRGLIGSMWGDLAPYVYESNLDPMLRFLHTQDIQPCGWVTIRGVSADDCSGDPSEVIGCNYEDVLPAAAPMAAAPFKTISWDIECFSSSGDFPLAKKTFKRLAKDLYAAAPNGEAAVKLIEEAMVWDGCTDVQAETGVAVAPIICKYRLPPDSRRIFKANMYRDAVYVELEKNLREKNGDRESAVDGLTESLNRILGQRFPITGDPIIQIGAVVAVNNEVTERHIFVYPSCDEIDGVIVHVAATEKEILMKFFEWTELMNPDILVGYNVFGFDERYLWDRAEELGIESELSFQSLNRLTMDGVPMKLEESYLSSSALGDNFLYMWNTDGRLQVDLYHYVKRTMQLPSYKLDDVAMHMMSGDLVAIADEPLRDTLQLTLSGAVKDIRVGRALKLLDESGEAITSKLEIVSVENGGKQVTVIWPPCDEDEWLSIKADAEKWVIVKDDVSPAEIFKYHCGTSADRAKVAKYCIQDCDLVLELYKKLEVFMNAMAMANVCSVPVRYIFTRGQGIKIESLIAKECLALNKCIMTLPSPAQRGTNEVGYEGAIVLDPIPSFYNRSPIGVGDFASLYPSTIVSENISHDTLVWVKDYDDDNYLIRHVWGSNDFDNLEDVDYTDIKYDLLIPDPEDKRKTPRKIKAGIRVCRYAQDKPGTMPIIIKKLLAARKAKRNEAARETDPLRAVLLDTEQLAYKTTANSLYGQLGSGTFKMRLQDLAASTTAYGRLQIMFAKAVIEKFYGPESGDPRCGAIIMYGDTDSLFIEFNPYNPITGERLKGREAREAAINLTIEAGHLVSHALKPPHDFEFDKVYDPLLMFSKKRYAGKMFESNPDDFVYKYMGIALKRRDNAPIVKKIYGNAMKMVLDAGDVEAATKYVQESALELVQGKTSLGLLTITKSLRAEYAKPQSIAHKVLADRMAARDPGTAPAAGDRIGYVFIKPLPGQTVSKLQGDRVETPAFVRANTDIELDAAYYIEHQIAAPVSQMFGLLLEDMPGYEPGLLPATYDEMDMDSQITFREKIAEKLLFKPALDKASAMDARRVMTNMFPGATVETKVSTRKPRAKKEAVAAAAAKPEPAVQMRMTDYFKNKEFLNAVKKITKSDDASSIGSKSSGGGSGSPKRTKK